MVITLVITMDLGNLKYNLIDYINTFENPTSLTQFVDQFIFRFLGGEPSENIRQDLMNIFGDSQNHWAGRN
jgi:hypothetical protein